MKRNLSAIMATQFVILMLAALLIALGQPTRAQAQQGIDDMKQVFGEDMDLVADSIEMQQNKEGKLDTMISKGKVVLTSKKMNVDCDILTYALARDRMVATGRPVNIRKEDVKATCQNFNYSPKNGKAILTGNPKVWQKANGRWSAISGEVITMTQLPGGAQTIIVDSGSKRARMKMTDSNGQGKDTVPADVSPAQMEMVTGDATDTKTASRASGEPVAIDPTKLDKIPETTFQGE